jgi:hypothetical protein
MHELTKHSLAIAQCPLCSTSAHPPANPQRTANAQRGYTARLPADTLVVIVTLSTPAAQAQAPHQYEQPPASADARSARSVRRSRIVASSARLPRAAPGKHRARRHHDILDWAHCACLVVDVVVGHQQSRYIVTAKSKTVVRFCYSALGQAPPVKCSGSRNRVPGKSRAVIIVVFGKYTTVRCAIYTIYE